MALAGLVLAGMGATAWWRYDLARREAACEAEGDEIEAVWNATRAQALRDGMLASGANEAATTADKVLPWLAEQAAQWRDARVSACSAAHVHARWEPAVLERSLWCLDDRRMELESLVVELSAADADVMRRAVGAAAGLESIAACSDERALEVLVIPPVDPSTLREVRMELARAGGLRRAGRYDKGLEQATSALMQAREHGWAPLVAVAHLEVGRLLDDRGAYAEAEAELERAYFEAAKAGVPIVSFQAATALVDTVGVDEARHADGHRWARLADVALGGVADREQLARSSLLAHIASLHADTGAYTDARALYEQALSLREQALGPDHPEVVTLLHNLAFVDEKTGDYRDAKARLERALAVRIETLGPNHPDVATSLNNLANVEHALDANAQAMALHTRALAIRRAALGPDHPEVAASLNNLANLHSVANEPAKARALYERALAIRTRVHGPSHPDVAQTLHNLASIHDLTGEPERALPLFERALAIREETLGPTHPAVAQTLGSMGTTQLALGHDARARGSLERAVDIREKALGPTHPKLASTLVNLASVYVASGRHDEARALLERALAIREEALGPTHADVVSSLNQLAICILTQGQARQALPLAQRAVDTVISSGVEGSVAAKARFVLAQVLWELPPDQGRDRPRARALAHQAHATAPAGLGEDIAAWLAAHGS